MSTSSPKDRKNSAEPRSRSRSGGTPQIGSYRILEVIGKGGMGTVYKAVHTGLDRVVALKVLPSEYAHNPVLVKRFRREAKSAARLHHPNIVAIHDQGEADGNLYLVLEYVEGEDLHSLIRKRKRIPPRRSLEIIKQAVKALVHAHSKGIVHRDIKPSNLLIRRDGVLKLGDLGLARIDAAQEAQVTRAGTTVGTVDYMPPEQARDSKLADARSDIYSLGCTLYHMLAGQPPFPTGEIPEKLLAHAKKQPVAVQDLNPEVPDDLAAVLHRMMAKDPAARYQSAAELLEDLEQLKLRRGPAPRSQIASLAEAVEDEQPAESVPVRSRRSEAVRTEEKPPPPLMRSRSRSRRKSSGSSLLSSEQWMYVAGGAGVLMLIGLIVYVAVNMGEATSGAGGNLNRSLPVPPAPPPGQATPPPGGEQAQQDGAFPEVGIIKTEEGKAPKAGDDGSTQQPVLATALSRDGFVPPWYGAAPGEAATRTLRLRRWTSLTDPKPGTFADLQAACDALAPNETVAIEIADQGPLFLREIRATKGKKLILRAAAGYEPLLVLEPPAQSGGTAAPATQYLFDSGKVELELEGLHFAAMLDGSMGAAPISLVRAGSAVTVRRCTFTVVQDPRYRTVGDPANAAQRPAFGAGEVITPRRGKADRAAAAEGTGPREFAAGVSAVRVGGMAPAAEAGRDSPQAAPIRVLVESCFVRGAAVAALSVETPAADVLVRNTLVVSGDAPALEVVSGSPAPNQEEIILRVIGSTLVSERNGVLLAHATGTGKPPTAHVQVLDSTIAHPRGGGTGELLLADRWSAGTQLRGVHWQSRNSRYLGWSKLAAVTKPRRTVATTSDDWRELWSVEQPEVSIDPAGGPTRPKAAPGFVTADPFAESHTDTAPADEVPPDDAPPEVTQEDAETEPDSAANSTQIGAVQRKTANDPIGCAIDALPALPAYLHERAFQPFALPEPPQSGPAGSNAPPIRIELTDPQTDLATELRRTQWEENQWIVVRGSGQRLVSPIRIEGKSLRLQFEAARGGEPLTLIPRLGRAGEAMIEVIGGDLEIVGGRFESTKAQPSSPNWLIRAAGGNVQLTNCWLKGPYPPTEHFEGVLFWGRGSPAAPAQAQKAPAEKFCRLTNCLLVGTGSLIYAWMPGRNLFVENTAAATSGNVFDLELAGPDDPAGTVTVRQSTLWAHGAFFKVGGTSAAGGVDRLPLRLSALQCVFASPLELAGRPHRTMLLACDPNLISEAQIAWHGRDNGYADLRDAFTPVVGAGAGAAETEARPLSATEFDRKWRRIWGPWHEQHPLLGTRIAWRTAEIQSNELKPGDFMLADDSEAQTWGPAGGSLGAETGRLPAAPPEDAGKGDAKDKPVLNF